MDWTPIPNDDWTPLEHERDLFFNVYIDETSQTKNRYLIIGGLVVPLTHAAQFEADIIAARANTVVSANYLDGTPREMKWEKVSAFNVECYKKVVDTAYNFRRLYKLPLQKDVAIHCVCVDTSVKSLRQAGDGDIEIGYDKQFFFLCVAVLAKRYQKQLFQLFPDRRHPRRTERENRDMLNRGVVKYNHDKREYPFRRLIFADPEGCQGLQVVDIIIGGIAYKLNGHYDKPKANPARRELCDYLYNLFKITDIFYQFQLPRTDFFTLTPRPKPPYRRREFPPKRY